MENLKTLTENFAEVKREFMDKTEKALKKELIQFMKDNPTIEAIKWKQYTPYFNDGDACEFRICEPYFKIQGKDEEDSDYNDGFITSYRLDDEKDAKLIKVMDEFSSLLQNDSLEDVLLAAFDDHVEVTVTADGEITVDEYSHD